VAVRLYGGSILALEPTRVRLYGWRDATATDSATVRFAPGSPPR
jgi:hypothetical protein